MSEPVSAAPPLPLAYRWRPSVVVTTVALLIGCTAVIRGGSSGRLPVVLGMVVLWGIFLASVVARRRAYLQLVGTRLRVRHIVGMVEVSGSDVIAVRRVLTGRGPSFRLLLRPGPDGRRRRAYVPSAMLHGGQSTLFAWLLREAPDADLDRGSRRTLELLRTRGLVE